MERTEEIQFKQGGLREAIRAYRKHKAEWQSRMDVKLADMEEEIRKAKADPFYKMETL